MIDYTPLTRLNLCAPLLYTEFACQDQSLLKHEENIKENEEILLCYKLNPVQSLSIEPDRDCLLGNMVFIGQKSPAILNGHTEETDENKLVLLPQGNYLFTQRRSETVLCQDEWLDLAIEQQKDGLWEGNKPKNLLYVRFLHEDEAFVTQIFRAL
jgi:hypothetical protein